MVNSRGQTLAARPGTRAWTAAVRRHPLTIRSWSNARQTRPRSTLFTGVNVVAVGPTLPRDADSSAKIAQSATAIPPHARIPSFPASLRLRRRGPQQRLLATLWQEHLQRPVPEGVDRELRGEGRRRMAAGSAAGR